MLENMLIMILSPVRDDLTHRFGCFFLEIFQLCMLVCACVCVCVFLFFLGGGDTSNPKVGIFPKNQQHLWVKS